MRRWCAKRKLKRLLDAAGLPEQIRSVFSGDVSVSSMTYGPGRTGNRT